jgi:hypothetical protein
MGENAVKLREVNFDGYNCLVQCLTIIAALYSFTNYKMYLICNVSAVGACATREVKSPQQYVSQTMRCVSPHRA